MAWAPDYIDDVALSMYVRITDDIDDVEIANAITGASRAIDEHCNRQFGQLAAPASWSYVAWPNMSRGQWSVDIDDLMTAVGLIVEVPTVGPTVEYTLEPRNAAGQSRPWTRIVFDRAAAVHPVPSDGYAVNVTAQFGWLAIPAPVVLATKMQGARFLSRRESPYGIAGSPDSGTEMRLLSRVDPDVGVSLRGLVRPRRVG